MYELTIQITVSSLSQKELDKLLHAINRVGNKAEEARMGTLNLHVIGVGNKPISEVRNLTVKGLE